MKSIYKQDFGNGVIVYADDFVKTGKWVYNCENSRLISRHPLPTPTVELKKVGRLIIGDMYFLKDTDKVQATTAIKAITKIENWYNQLRYRNSGLDENSELANHDFDLLSHHDGRLWALVVSQSLDYRHRSTFVITAAPYDSATYIDYQKMLQTAAKSCPVPQ